MKIKICGITNEEDLIHAARLGADMLGINLWAPSPRSTTIENAARMVAKLRVSVNTIPEIVLVFVEPDADFLTMCISTLSPGAIQIHGAWNGATEFKGVPVIRAIQLGSESDIEEIIRWKGDRLLLDARVEGMHGGTGRTIPAELLAKVERPYLLAGGLTPENVAVAVARFHPAGVDVASGVESAPGRKDHVKMEKFIGACRAAGG